MHPRDVLDKVRSKAETALTNLTKCKIRAKSVLGKGKNDKNQAIYERLESAPKQISENIDLLETMLAYTDEEWRHADLTNLKATICNQIKDLNNYNMMMNMC